MLTVQLLTTEANQELQLEGGDVSLRQIRLAGVDGTVWDLTDTTQSVQAAPDQVIWGTAPARVTFRNRIGVPGAEIVGSRHDVRDMVIPLRIRASTPSELDGALADLARATDPTRGDVTVTVVRVDGTSRSIDGRVLDGVEQVSMRSNMTHELRLPLSIRAHHPYWRDTATETIQIDPPPTAWETESTTGYDDSINYDDPIPYTGVIAGDIEYDDVMEYDSAVSYDGSGVASILLEIRNVGDVTAWPTFTVMGPADSVEAVNLSTGEQWILTDGLADAETMVIVTQPGNQSVRIGGVLALGQLSDSADLWGLPARSTSLVSFGMPGRTGDTDFVVEFASEWLTC